MPYVVIEGFQDGLDARRLEAATAPGALKVCRNAHINRGGEIEKRKQFVPKYSLPAGTFGLQALNDQLYVFGSNLDPGVPSDISYQQLEHESGASRTMTHVLGSDVSKSKIFANAVFDNGDIRPFYDGAYVPDFLSGSGTFAEGLILRGAPYTYENKVYLASETNMLFSGSGVPNSFDEGASDGSGLLDISTRVSSEAFIQGYSAYQGSLAVFTKKNITRWAVDPDPTAYQLLQVLPNIITVAPRSIIPYGDHDVFFLAATGMRSIRAVNSSLSAAVTDVGTPIDDILIARMDALGEAAVERAVSVIEPKDARHLMALGSEVWAFTYFPTSQISSWSTWEPGFDITDWATIGTRLYARSGNVVYLYGGDGNNEYTTDAVVVEIPYIDGRRLGDWKFWTFLDVILSGTWSVYVNTDPNNSDYWIRTAVITKTTLAQLSLPMQQYGPIFKMKFVHEGDADQSAKLSKIIIHYKGAGKR